MALTDDSAERKDDLETDVVSTVEEPVDKTSVPEDKVAATPSNEDETTDAVNQDEDGKETVAEPVAEEVVAEPLAEGADAEPVAEESATDPVADQEPVTEESPASKEAETDGEPATEETPFSISLANGHIHISAGKVKHPDFSSGDTITVHYKIREGGKERIQQFKGVVLQRKGTGATETMTIRKVSGGIGVERIIPVASPFIDKIEVHKHGKVRRSRIFYLRDRKGKSARIGEKKS